MLNVVSYTDLYKKEWDIFVQNQAKNATFLFKRNFMEYHKDRFEDASVIIFDEHKIKAVFPANTKDKTVFSHQGLTYGGLICAAEMDLEDYIRCFQSLFQYYNNLEVEQIWIKEIPEIYCSAFNNELSYVAFLLEANLYRRDILSVIDLTKPFQFSNNRIRMCKKAEQKNYFVKETDSLQSFWEEVLIPRLSEKHNAKPVHTLEEITALKNAFPLQIRQFNVYNPEGKTAGGVTVFETDKVAHLQYIAGTEEGNKDGALDLLQKILIEHIFAKKHFFDFGISNEQNGKIINKGLLHWKEGFGSKAVIQNFYEFNTSNFTKLDAVWK